ncbi:hypothetical protein [Fictibacillus sp. 18YEL24]|uniref:hypothetical protein n=1 Tax=Fictibacillus sp. 18YEL24 TaxID=2745875 RepID=UPI0018CDC5DB|nr:hypothetical protein [Fictibacillus sp. 18YEL24]MBH0170760.1 hypothetical protein [Fictibacillus sp. 18YEL24]
MELINTLEKEYELYGIRWKERPYLIMTDYGEKRIRYWSEKDNLNWHIRWRDESSKGSSAVPDRMIRTKSGEAAIKYGNRWLTVHDHTKEWYGCEDIERWGQFIGTLLNTAMSSDNKDVFVKQTRQPVFDLNQCITRAQKYLEANFQCMVTSINESKQRLEFSHAIKNNVRNHPLPVLDRELSIKNGRKIFHFLFYQGSEALPIKGYLPLRKFLVEWLEQTSTSSLKFLLTEVNKHFSLESEQGLLLLAEVVTPWELYDCLDQLDNSSLERMIDGLKKYEVCWESNRTLVKTVTEWFDEKRRKVAL